MKCLIFLLCAASAWAVDIKTLREIGPRIVNGKEASSGQFPYQVAIYGRSRVGAYLCGGALISDEWVITAAHCVIDAVSAQIYSGTISLSSRNRTTSAAAEFIAYEGFDANLLTNDVGLIRLQKPVIVDENTKPIRLAEEPLDAGVKVVVSGWGQTSDDTNSDPDILNFIEVTTLENLLCRAYYGATYIVEAVVCTETGNPLKSPCLGDSGAPVVQYIDDEPVHVATFSFVNGYGCEFPYPAGHTRTASFRDWIKEKTGI